MGAQIAYFDIASADTGRIAGFYAELFDWTVSAGPDDDYSMIDTGGEVGGGIGPTAGADVPGGITMYVKVDDLQAYLDKAEKLGGTTVVPPTELPGDYGSFAVFSDPDGNNFGLWA
jgi:hypothetical protein